MTSSVRAKMAQVEKEKKIATREREESKDNKLEHIKASVGGVSAKASSGDSSDGGKKVRARTKKGHFVADDPSTPENEAWVEAKPKKKSAAPKAPAKKRGRPRKTVQ